MADAITILIAAQIRKDALFFNEAVKLLPAKVIFHRFKSGVMLIQYLHVTRPRRALIFFEAYMPYKNGFDCLTEIRASKKYKDLTLIMLTAANDESIKKAIERGINYVIKRPDHIEDMKDMILYFAEEGAKSIPRNIKRFLLAHRVEIKSPPPS